MNDIYRGFEASITFKAKDSEGEPIDLTSTTAIRACLGALVLTLGSGCTLVSGPLGEWTVAFTTPQTLGLTLGKDTIEGQVELGTTVNPIEFSASVNVKDKPCP